MSREVVAVSQPRSLLRPEFVSVVCAQMTFNFCLSTFLLLPKYLSTQLSAAAQDIGRINAVQGLTAVLAVPLVSSLVDRVGRKPLMAAGAVLAVAYSLCWLGIDHLGPMAFALQILCGLAFILMSSGSSTLVADLAPPERLSQAIGVYGAANIAMNALAPALAEPAAARFGWRAAFILAAVAAGLALMLTRFVREPARPTPSSAPDATHARSTTWGVARRTAPYLFGMASCGAALGAVFTFYQPFVLAQGARNVSLFFIGFTLAAVSTRLGLGGLADRFGRRHVALRAYALYTVVVLAMTQLTPDRLLVLGLAFGLAHGFFYPALNALALEYTHSGERGRAMTLVSGAFQLGSTISVLCFGWVADAYGYGAVFFSAALVTLCGLCVLYNASTPRMRAHELPSAAE